MSEFPSSNDPASEAAPPSDGFTSFDPHLGEERNLAPYGMRSRDSRGREYPESADPLRTPFQRDRDRILHSTAFRRLEYKTQVFVNHEGDHYRTRLTHTLEVAQVSRTVGRVLGLNEDLVEAIALSHDLGHPPFGHAGETQLDQLMEGYGGFNHNLHALRVVDLLEKRYPDFPGLNLSWEIREAMAKHYGRFDQEFLLVFGPDDPPVLEAQVADIGDSLAYDSHDLDDGLRSGILSTDALSDIELWREAEATVLDRWPGVDTRRRIARTISQLIALQVSDLLATTRANIEAHGVDSVAEVRQSSAPIVSFSRSMDAKKRTLQSFLREELYHHHRSLKIAAKGRRFIERIFREYLREPAQLPKGFRERLAAEGTHRVVCDYVAGMTDRFCLEEYRRLFVPFADGDGGALS